MVASFSLLKRLKDPTIFQGDLKKRHYFEGWYFKQSNLDGDVVLSIIPGISLAEEDRHAFIQLLDGTSGVAYYERFGVEEFKPGLEPFSVRIRDNFFSLSGVELDIRGEVSVKGSLRYSDLSLFRGGVGMRGVMGWYGFVPFLETYHGLISMDHVVDGSIVINGDRRVFDAARGYIEKDWGCSFPSSWVWFQANSFKERGVSLMVSVAVIPWLHSSFVGHLAIFLHRGEVINLSTYCGGKVTRLEKMDTGLQMRVENKRYSLDIWADSGRFVDLRSPKMGIMKGRTAETLRGFVEVSVFDKKEKSTLFSGASPGLGLEIMDDEGELKKGVESSHAR
jgi:tocopherol cyclase